MFPLRLVSQIKMFINTPFRQKKTTQEFSGNGAPGFFTHRGEHGRELKEAEGGRGHGLGRKGARMSDAKCSERPTREKRGVNERSSRS